MVPPEGVAHREEPVEDSAAEARGHVRLVGVFLGRSYCLPPPPGHDPSQEAGPHLDQRAGSRFTEGMGADLVSFY